MPLISFLILSSYVFVSGDSAEEFCMPLLAISLYYMLNYYKNIYPNKMPIKQIIINGIIAGCVLCIKYNLLGFWLGFAGFLCIGLLINKKIKEAFLTGIYFLLGMAIPVIPWIIYFGVNDALYDMFKVYFLVNISSYATQVTILKRIMIALKEGLIYARNLWLSSAITFIGYIYTIARNNIIPNKYGKVTITITIILSIIGVFYGANHVYYFLILMPFSVLGLIFIAKIIEKYIHQNKIIIFITPIYLIIIIVITLFTSHNFEFRKIKKEELVQYQFAELIKEKPNATILNYGFLDGGFYTVTNTIPNIKYFHKPNIKYENYPQIMDDQNKYIKEKTTDFVIIRIEKEEDSYNIPHLYENYNKIKTVYEPNVKNYYILFRIK